MYYKKRIFIYILFFLFSFNPIYSYENKIIFKVDNEIVTTIDLYNEVNYLKSTNKDLARLEENKIFEIAKNSLIQEKIKIKEILKYTDQIILKDELFKSIIESIYKQQNINNLDEFIKHINQYDVSIEYVKKKISSEIIWNDLIISKFSNKIRIDTDKIKNGLMQDLSKNSKEYFLREIIFDVPFNSNVESKIKEVEKDIFERGFKNAVLIHSNSTSSLRNAGEIGWINENSLNKEIKNILDSLDIGDISKTIIVPGGFLILKIDNIRFVENKEFDINKKLQEAIRIKRSEQLNNYSSIYFNKIKKEFTINEEI